MYIVNVSMCPYTFLFCVPEDNPTYNIGYEFAVRQCSDKEAVVAFESVKFPGHFVSLSAGKGGVATLVEQEVESLNVQFTVFVKVSMCVCVCAWMCCYVLYRHVFCMKMYNIRTFITVHMQRFKGPCTHPISSPFTGEPSILVSFSTLHYNNSLRGSTILCVNCAEQVEGYVGDSALL